MLKKLLSLCGLNSIKCNFQVFNVLISLFFIFFINFNLIIMFYNEIIIGVYGYFFILSVIFVCFFFTLIVFNLLLLPYIDKLMMLILLITSSIIASMVLDYKIIVDSDLVATALETNMRETLDLVSVKLLLFIFFLALIPSMLIMKIDIIYGTFVQNIKSRFIAIAICSLSIAILVFPQYKDYASFGRNNRDFQKSVMPINFIGGIVRHIQRELLANRQFVVLDENVANVPLNSEAYNVFVMIVGETARANNFSLNGYERLTNPLLSKQDIVYYKDVVSCGTLTAISVPCMFSHLPIKNFDKNEAEYTTNALDIVKSAGYDIVWFENDDGCKGVCRRIPWLEIVSQRQESRSSFCYSDYCLDESLLEKLKDKLQNINNNTVIMLHTMGSHGPTYYKRYSDDFKQFQPTCDTADIVSCTRESIVNTYDNTILYTDFIISQSIDELKKYPHFNSSLLYVSDHGESLGENGIYLHGLPYKIAPDFQKRVPMVLWISENMQNLDNIDYSCMKQNSSQLQLSHDYVFSSILGITKIKHKNYDKEFDVLNSCRIK